MQYNDAFLAIQPCAVELTIGTQAGKSRTLEVIMQNNVCSFQFATNHKAMKDIYDYLETRAQLRQDLKMINEQLRADSMQFLQNPKMGYIHKVNRMAPDYQLTHGDAIELRVPLLGYVKYLGTIERIRVATPTP